MTSPRVPFTNEDDMEQAYQVTLSLMDKSIIQYTLSLIQDVGMEVDNLSDFMKGYYVNYFITTLRTIHIRNRNNPIDENTIFQEYLKKIASSKKLDGLLKDLY